MNIEVIEQEITKTEQRIEGYRERLRALRQRKVNEENNQILRAVRTANVSIPELQKLLSPSPEAFAKHEREDTKDV